MMTPNIFLLISAVVSVAAAKWKPVCPVSSQDPNVHGLFIKGVDIVDRYSLKTGLTVVVENTRDAHNVTVKCVNPEGDDEIYDVRNKARGDENINCGVEMFVMQL